jgi:NAD(P)-dependent dehydrogenase (short-subunit alcohol dehydrogenase family)
MEPSLKDRTVLVTGATNGIGLVTARELSRMGGQVTILSRNADKCAAIAGSISKDTGNPVEFISSDLSSLDGIAHASAEFKNRHTHLDLLVNNAGGFFIKRIITPDGLEMTFALNHLNYFLLTNLLLDVLKAGNQSRVINVSSGAHVRLTAMDFDNLQGERKYSPMPAYAQSKLANLLFTYELARRLEGSGVTVNALHPGYVHTGFARNNGLIFNIGSKLSARIFGRSPEEGAQTSIYLASSPEVSGITGAYFHDCKQLKSSPASYNKEDALRLWNISLALTSRVMAPAQD